jgi:putative chitinase
MKLDRTKFFAGVKSRIDPTLNQQQVDGLNAILDGLEAGSTISSIPRAAYALATIFHETAGTFQPIHEYGSTAYFNKRYGPNTKVGRQLGNTQAGDGARYAGRGYVQLTGRRNYRKFGIEDTPDDALKPDVAFRILADGMVNGTFTGKSFANYINGNQNADYVGARKIINGTDKAGLIAGYAKSFEKILLSANSPGPASAGEQTKPEAIGGGESSESGSGQQAPIPFRPTEEPVRAFRPSERECRARRMTVSTRR